MKVIVNFGEKKVVVPCGIDGDISIRELIHLATAKYCKLSYNNSSILNSDQVQLRLNNGAVVDSDDRVCDVADDKEELFALINSQSSTYSFHTATINSNGELSSSLTSSNLSSSLSEHDRLIIPSSINRHEVIVTDADLRTRSLRVKNDSQQTKMTYSPPRQDKNTGMYNIQIDEQTGEKIFSIKLPKENSPLGIHVIPCNENEQEVNGLVLQNIESDGRIQRQGILEINDRIIEINRTNIEKCSFDKAQLIFRTALIEPELELRIRRRSRSTLSEINLNTDHDPNMNSLNTRKLGKIIKISLIKGIDGLGFKLASRDNPTGLANPIYVKTIFPKGAAIEDGRLQRGDRLLSVNSIDITQMSLPETVGLLRETRVGETVELCISRQRDGSIPTDEDSTIEIKAQIMTFDIPLNDTSSAGLGITLKGKTSIVDGKSVDLGIFVKSILTGGAASRDNRLRSNDQLLIINDSSLVKLSNLEAAAVLHEAVRREIHPGHIKVTISRLPKRFDEQTRHIKEVDLSPLPLLNPNNNTNDENELDLTTYVPPPLTRKPPIQHSNRHYSRLTDSTDIRSSSPRSSSLTTRIQSKSNDQQSSDDVDTISNPFDRETPFRQSVSEKRRLTNQPNKQVLQWKQRSFQENRTQHERKAPVRVLQENDNRLSSNLPRSTSFESIQMTNDERISPKTDDEQKRQAKLRSRACNDSFRQAVDKSYAQNRNTDDDNEKLNKTEKQKFRFTNLFTTKSKQRKDNQDENRTSKSFVIQPDESRSPFYPSSRQESPQPQSQGYQPYRFDSLNDHTIVDQFTPQRYESHFQPKTIAAKSSHSKTSYPSIPRQFYHMNINGSQSLKQHQQSTHSTILQPTTYPSTFTVQPAHFTSYSHNFDNPIHSSQQQTRRTAYPSTTRNFFHIESPANV